MRVLCDLVLIVLAFFGLYAFQLPHYSPAALPHGLSLVAGLLFINTASGLYHPGHRRSFSQTCARAALALLLALSLAYVAFGLLPPEFGAREESKWLAMAIVAMVVANRVWVARLDTTAQPHSRILILGSGAPAKDAAEAIAAADPRTRIVGFVAGPNETRTVVDPDRLVRSAGSLKERAATLDVDEIVVALSERRGGSMPLRELLDCKIEGVKISDLSTYFEKVLGQIRIDHLYAGWLVFGDGFCQGAVRSVAKRVFDIVMAFLLLALAAPIMLATVVCIALEGKGSILYRQERVGRGGRKFSVLKFRSMRLDAEKAGVPQWASARDDRITRVGSIIRRFRIDEFPQLFNVLKGDMSLVGPRPERPFFVDNLTRDIPFYAVRHCVAPGVTGWAQVRYQYGATVADSREKLQFDLYYVKNHSLFLDIVILFETIGVVLSGKGAR